MANIVGQHSVATFTSPVNGTTPIDANSVRGNDNTLRTSYVDHDADPGIHLQSSLLANRPLAGTAGRKWLTTDSGSLRLWYDDGSVWSEAAYLSTGGGTVSGNLSVTGTATIGGTVTLNGRTYTFPASETANYFLKTNGSGTLTWGTLAETIALTDLSDVTITSATSGQPLVYNGTSWANASSITASVTGNATTATTLQTARTINGTSFDGSANITVTAAAGTLTGTTLASNVVSSSLTSVGTLANLTVTNPISGSVTGSSGSTTGNAATATALQTARTINGTSFDGTANITVTAAAGTLTGSTLASGVTASSLTSVGTLTNLAVSGTIASQVTGGTPAVELQNVGTAAGRFMHIGTTGSDAYIGTASSTGGTLVTGSPAYSLEFRNDTGFAWGTGSALAAVLTSTGLGIGTSSPSYKLNVLAGAGAQSIFQAGQSGVSNGYTIASNGTALTHTWYSGGSASLTLDTSGNLGLGVTPSAWGSLGRAMQFQYGMSVYSASGGIAVIGNNMYSNPGTAEYYIANGYASRYYQYAGTHVWNTAPSGTAGAAISFTQAMTLDASGNLGVGETSPAARLHVKSASEMQRFAGNASGVAMYQTWYNSAGTRRAYFGFGSNNDSTFYVHNDEAGAMVFDTNATERARITSAGEWLVGASSNIAAGPREYVKAGGIPVIYGDNVGAGGYTFNSGAVSNGGTYYHFQFLDAGTSHGSITSNGTNTAYNTTSDARLKTNVQDAADASALIDAIQIRQYDWKSNGSHQRYGVVAQEVDVVFPEMVTKGETDDDMWSVDYSKLVPMLVKEIQSLRQRVAQLEK